MIINNKVLLLNNSYEPLLVITVKKAILLYFNGKIEFVEKGDSYISSIYMKFQIPKIVRLKKYIYVKKKQISLTRKNIFKRDNHICQYCGKSSQELTIDHVIPKDKGGVDNWKNLVTACRRCNTKKGNSNLKEIPMELIKLPYKPSYLLNLHAYAEANKSWKKYIYYKDIGA